MAVLGLRARTVAAAGERGWTLVDMKNDWGRIWTGDE